MRAIHIRTFPRLTIIGLFLAVGALLLLIMAPANAADAPTGLTATAGDTQVTLTWNDPNDSTITGYRVLWMEPTDKLDDPSKENNPQVSIEAGDMFGQSVGIDGGRAVVGAPFQKSRTNANQDVEKGGWGHAYSIGSSGWSYDEFLALNNPQEDGRLGSAVAMAGRTAVAGAPSYYHSQNDDPGEVTIAVWDSTTESWDGKFSAIGDAVNDFFGTSVAIDGGTAVVGATGVGVGSATFVGKAYVFTRNSSNQDTGVWSQETVLDSGSNAGQGTVFGTSVAVDGNTIVVGSQGEDTYKGAAYVFTKSNNVWSRVARLTAPNSRYGDGFGGSVAIDGDTIVVGAQNWDGGSTDAPQHGAAFVFTKNNNVWSRVARLTASDYVAQDQFGFAVAVEGDTIVVGDFQDDDDGDDSGSVYLFTKPSGGWATANETVQLTASDGAAGDNFGYSVAARGDRFIVGAPGVASEKGAAYVYSIPEWTDITVPASNSGTMSHTVTGLDNGVEYTFWVLPVVSSDLGPASDSVTATPTAAKAATPANLTALGIDQEVTLSWDDPNDASIIRFRYRQKEGDGTFGSWNDIELTDIDSSETGKLKYTVSNLTNGTTYTFQIFAKDNHEDSETSAEASATPAPPPPLPLVPPFVSNIGQVTDISVGVDADLSRDQAQGFRTGGNETGYVLGSIDVHVHRAPVSGDLDDLTVSVRSPNNDANPGDTALYTLTNPDTIEPGLVRFTAPASAQLTANSDYFVHVAFSGSGTPPRLRTTASTNEDAGAAANWSITNYRHQADTSSPTGWAYQSNLLKISINQVLDPPVAPANLDATVGDGQVVLSWDDPQDAYITKYQYSTDGGASYTDLALTDIDSSETGKFKYTVENLANGMTYTLAVRAVNISGDGVASTKTVVMMPTAPTGFTATPLDAKVELSWDDPSNGTITKYQYSTDGGTNFADIPDSNASTITYNVTVLSDGTEAALANGTTYTLAVRAVNISGAGPAATGTATPTPAPLAPRNLEATPGDGQVALSWDDPGDSSITKYQYSTDYMSGGENGNNGVGTFNNIDLTSLDFTNDPGVVKYTVSGLANGVTHTLALRAVNPSGEGAVSTATALMIPAAPKLSAAPGNGLVVLSWDDPDNLTISEYQLSQSDPPEWSRITGSNATTTTHTVTGLTNYTAYSFQIRAVNETGEGPASNSASATPRLPKPAKPVGLSTQTGDARVQLSWQDPKDSTIDKYKISEVIPENFLTASDGAAGAHFGISVAIDGDTAVVGADRVNSKRGSAYIFTRDSNDDWTQQAKLDGENTGDQFGWSVAVDGDTVVVGAHAYDGKNDDDETLVNSGAVYVFTKPATTNGWKDWKDLDDDGKAELTAELTATVPEAYAFFGGSVDLDGDTLVIGSRLANVSGYLSAGAAYVFTEDTDTGEWSQQAKLTASDGSSLSYLGYSVAVDGDTVLAGAFGDYTGLGRVGYGSAYVFDKPPDGWTDGNETAKLTASDRRPSDYFGFSVALDGDTAVIGARQHNDPETGAGTGSAYVFTRDSAGVWGEKANLTASDAAAGDNFGVSVAVEGDTVVVGSWQDDDNGRNSGSAYVFEKPALGWASTFETLKLTAPDGAVNGRFGWSVAVDLDDVRGDFALVGAYSDDANGMDAGSAYVLGIPVWGDITNSGSGTTSHTVTALVDGTNLANGTEYDFQIRAVNKAGGGPASDGVSATPLGVPDAPVGLSATGDQDAQAPLSWTKATDDNTIAPITRYEYSKDSGETFENIPGSGAETDRYTVTGLDNGTAYTFAIRAVNVIGEGPHASANATPTESTPDKPALRANAGDTQVHLEWDDPGDSSIDRYEYKWTGNDNTASGDDADNPDDWLEVPKGMGRFLTHRYTVAGLTNTVTYTFQIRATDDQDTGPSESSNAVDATPLTLRPSTPAGLKATGRHESVELVWDDPNDSSIDKYQYQYKENTGGDFTESDVWRDIPESAPGETNAIAHTVDLLTNGVTYKFRIRAVDIEADPAEGPESGEVEATPLPGEPNEPGNLNTAEDDAAVRLTWQHPGGPPIDQYEVQHLLRTSKLGASGGSEDDKFGYSVAVADDTAVIGAYGDDGNGADSGAAYVFTRNRGIWSQAAKLTASTGKPYDNFGFSVAVDGATNTVVVGAPGGDRNEGDDDATDSGSVYVFVKPATGWATTTETAKLTASDGEDFDHFGYSVAVSGGTVLAGAYEDDEGDVEESGSAYVFVNPATGWATTDTFTAKLTASNRAHDDNFGISVALDGDTAVIGAYGDDDNGIDSGSAYVFVKPATGWATTSTHTAKLNARDGAPGDWFGVSVALDGNTAVIGAYGDDDNGEDSGSAYIFVKPATGWATTDMFTAKLTASDGEAFDYFGYSVAVDGDVAVVGAYGNDNNGTDSGAAYVFTKDLSGRWSQTKRLIAEGPEAGDRFGYAVAVNPAVHTALVGAGSAHVLDIHDWEAVPGGSEATTHTVDGLFNNLVYEFKVRAVNLRGPGDPVEREATPQASGYQQPSNQPSNTSPRFSEGASTTRTVPEDAALGATVGGPVSATDVDLDPLRYSLSGGGQGSFQVDSGTGQLTTTALLDYETQSEYSLRLRVSDGQGGADEISVTVTVVDVDEPPSQPAAPEVSSTGPASLAVTWTAPDNRGPGMTDYDVQYREAGGEFRDAGHEGVGTSMTLDDMKPDTRYEVQVRASNAEGTSPWSESGRGETEEAPPTPTPELTPTPTPELTPTPTPEPTPTPTPEPTPTSTPEPTATPTPVPTSTPVSMGTPTRVPTSTPVPMNTPTRVPTSTPVPMNTPTRVPTSTPVPMNTPTRVPTSTPTPRPEATVTPTPEPTVTPTPEPTVEPVSPEAGSGDGGFPWWVIVAIVIGVAVGAILIVGARRSRR